jgi:rhodanese-related sulfurtransferase
MATAKTALRIGPDVTMGEILYAYPTAKIALFIRYHIGGCTSCGYQLTDTLAEVHQNYNIKDPLEEVLAAVQHSASVEAKVRISQQELASVLQRGLDLRLLDTRSTSEWQAGHLAGAQPVTVELTFNAIVFYSNEGRRSLDKAAYFQAYGFANARSLDGGLQAWQDTFESPLVVALL